MTTTESIASKSELVRQAASGLTDRIVQFENFLARLKGRTEAEYAHEAIVLKFQKVGKNWALFVRYQDVGSFTRLQEASLLTKLQAIRIFPELLSAIEGSQDRLIEQINTGVQDFDLFFDLLNPSKEAK